MRTLFSVSALSVCVALTSCSTQNVTKSDLAAFKLRDLTRFGQPHIVKVSRSEVEELDETTLRADRVATLAPKHRRDIPSMEAAPIDYEPPTLPEGMVAFDGSILPPKDLGSAALLDVSGFVPSQSSAGVAYPVSTYPAAGPQNFSIE